MEKRADKLHGRLNRASEVAGSLLVDGFHYLALFAIGAAVVWSAGHEFFIMAAKGRATIEDVLLLFIYLELGAMVGIYFKTNHMPVRFLIYVGITALTRLLISDIQDHHRPGMEVIYATGAILILAFATLVVRFGSARYPSPRGDDATRVT